jgi:outer membrane protein assembly factor BamB
MQQTPEESPKNLDQVIAKDCLDKIRSAPRASLSSCGRLTCTSLGGPEDPMTERQGSQGPPPRGVDSEPYLLPSVSNQRIEGHLNARRRATPQRNATLGDIGMAAEVDGPDSFEEAILVQPFDRAAISGIDPATLRMFRWDPDEDRLRPLWSSGGNVQLGRMWGRLRQPGVYVPIGLPRDRLLFEALRAVAVERRVRGSRDTAEDRSIVEARLRPLLELPDEAFDELRAFLTRIEIQDSVGSISFDEVEFGTGGHPIGFRLPGGLGRDEFRGRLRDLEVRPGGLPEEELFFPPYVPRNGEPPWNRSGAHGAWRGADFTALHGAHGFWKHIDIDLLQDLLPWLFDPDWWMYGHDARHTGKATGASDIDSITVSGLYKHAEVAVDGPVVSQPAVVDGKVYIGSGKQGGTGGTLYRIDLATGAIERSLPTSGTAFYSWVSGIGGTPAVTGGRVYFTGVHGTVYCVDALTFATIWSVSLKTADLAHNQPLNNPNSDSWSGPLVVGDRVYVGCGEGESAPTYGFVFCLDADSGNVDWCFCTCKFAGAVDNQPNQLPMAVAAPWASSHGFAVLPNPPETGCSVWSSCAYDHVNGAIYVGTGNSQYPHTAQPDEAYGSGLLSLDAVTGAFRGFFQPSVDDSYWPGDVDIDVPGGPTVYTVDGRRVVAFGSKAGSAFVLDAANINTVVARRQLLPRVGGSGLPGDRGTGIGAVVPTGGSGENSYGVFGTPAVHRGRRLLFVGLGGYNGMALETGGGDPTRTPFLRALHWDDLRDAWPSAVGPDNVSRYTNTRPPMYTSREVGLSSPAVVADVVFVGTSPPPFSSDRANLYALAVQDGHCLWSAGGLAAGSFCLGPAVYRNYVVVAAGDRVYIYRLGPRWRFPLPWDVVKPWPWQQWPPPEPRPAPVPVPPLPDPPPQRPPELA